MTPRGSVPAHLYMRLATNADADGIALLSRSEIEHELPWMWTPSRVRQAIAGRATNVAVAYDGGRLVAFGIKGDRGTSKRSTLHGERRTSGRMARSWLRTSYRTASTTPSATKRSISASL